MKVYKLTGGDKLGYGRLTILVASESPYWELGKDPQVLKILNGVDEVADLGEVIMLGRPSVVTPTPKEIAKSDSIPAVKPVVTKTADMKPSTTPVGTEPIPDITKPVVVVGKPTITDVNKWNQLRNGLVPGKPRMSPEAAAKEVGFPLQTLQEANKEIM